MSTLVSNDNLERDPKAYEEVADTIIEAYQAWIGKKSYLDNIKNTGKSLIRVSDLFSGPGGFSYGFKTALIENDIHAISEIAVDYDESALETYKANNSPKAIRKLDLFEAFTDSIEIIKKKLIEGKPIRFKDIALGLSLKKTDVLLCSPPCRGFSNLNNKTRRDDPRNALLISGVAAAIASKVKTLIVENVVEMRADKDGVLYEGINLLKQYGYEVETVILEGVKLGLPQTRRRMILVASTEVSPKIVVNYLSELDLSGVTAKDVFGIPSDYAWDDSSVPFMTATPLLSEENKARINFLHSGDCDDPYNLPNEHRPDCHKDGHSYPSVYGRIYPDKPVGTITTGFLSIGRGRFMHPFEKRGLNLREGARIQSFPDHYKFICDSKTTIASRLIGDAVPPLMSYWIGKAYQNAKSDR